MQKSLYEYLVDREKEHEFRFKTICELTDEHMDALEQHLQKYDVISVSTPKRTIFQTRPLDFYNTDAGSVYIVDIKTRLPVSAGILMQELQQKLGIPEREMRLKSIHDPVEIEAQEQIDGLKKNGSKKKEPEYKSKLEDSEYSDAEKVDVDAFHGETHKTNFLKDLEKNRRETPTEYKLKD